MTGGDTVTKPEKADVKFRSTLCLTAMPAAF